MPLFRKTLQALYSDALDDAHSCGDACDISKGAPPALNVLRWLKGNQVYLIIRADDTADAKSFARALPGFELDEHYGPFPLEKDSFFVRGLKRGDIIDYTLRVIELTPAKSH